MLNRFAGVPVGKVLSIATWALLLSNASLVGCDSGTHGGAAGVDSRSERTASQSAAPPDASGGSMRLDEPAARELAARLANDKFASSKLTDAEGRPVRPPIPVAADFRVRQADGRWHLSFGGPAGAWAEVSFDLDGKESHVEVGFAAD